MTESERLKKRTFDFAVAVFRLCRVLVRTPEARVPVSQLIRSGSSAAANYRAACRAKSRRDFISKIGTVIEEADESLFWLEFLEQTELLPPAPLQPLQSEANQLVAIFTASQKTARANEDRDRAHRKARKHVDK